MFGCHSCGSFDASRSQLFGHGLRGAIHKFVGFIQNHRIALRQNRVVIDDFDCKQRVIGDNYIGGLRLGLCRHGKALRSKGAIILTNALAPRDRVCKPNPTVYIRSIIAIPRNTGSLGPGFKSLLIFF